MVLENPRDRERSLAIGDEQGNCRYISRLALGSDHGRSFAVIRQ